MQWDVGDTFDLNLLRCPLYKLIQDSHEHLFFECPFSLKVWKLVSKRAGLHNIPSRLDDITTWCTGHDRGGEEAASVLSCAFIELNTCNAVSLDALTNLDKSGETAPPKFMKFFLVQKVDDSRRFVNRMHDEAAAARDCVAQLTALIAKLQAMEDQEEVHDSLLV
ncbi:hypothetical protein Tco_0214925 [Tanacetum coccineum]